jgi:hypothetical protein
MKKINKIKIFSLIALILLAPLTPSFADDNSNYQSASNAMDSARNEINELKISSSCDIPGLGNVASGLSFSFNLPHGPTMSSESLQGFLSSLSSAKSGFMNQIRNVCSAGLKIVVETPQNGTPMIPLGSTIVQEGVKVASSSVPLDAPTVGLETSTAITQSTDTLTVTVLLSENDKINLNTIAKLAYWERRLNRLKQLFE